MQVALPHPSLPPTGTSTMGENRTREWAKPKATDLTNETSVSGLASELGATG